MCGSHSGYIETPGVETDIWTPVAQQVGVPVVVEA
jgi:hypothetical protein